MDANEQAFTIEAYEEFRFEVTHEKSAEITLLSGTAEINGVELCLNTKYSFSGCKLALFTWHGCSLTATNADVAYVGKETCMQNILNLFTAINHSDHRVLVVGPQDSGKTSLCKTIANWIGKLCVAEKSDPCLLVDLDTNHGSISVPGTLAALMVSMPLRIQEDYCTTQNLSPPLAFYYGDMSPLVNNRLYKRLLSKLSSHINTLLDTKDSEINTEEDVKPQPKLGPVIIDCPAQFVEPNGFELLEHAITCFKGANLNLFQLTLSS